MKVITMVFDLEYNSNEVWQYTVVAESFIEGWKKFVEGLNWEPGDEVEETIHRDTFEQLGIIVVTDTITHEIEKVYLGSDDSENHPYVLAIKELI